MQEELVSTKGSRSEENATDDFSEDARLADGFEEGGNSAGDKENKGDLEGKQRQGEV